MWAKVLAGVMAAVSVAGVGVYVALPNDCCNGTCPLTGRPTTAPIAAGFGDGQPVNVTPASEQQVPSDALAACTGGLTISAEPAKKSKTGCSCCAD